uniref:EGF-like domain-containing protein n=1 Tax=Glossina pallidipes TaxID=7398 RepID=A0A1A9Z0J1_GLOPL
MYIDTNYVYDSFRASYYISNCLNNCHNHGKCVGHQCVCHGEWVGPDCEDEVCSNKSGDLQSQWKCIKGLCHCEKGYSGRLRDLHEQPPGGNWRWLATDAEAVLHHKNEDEAKLCVRNILYTLAESNLHQRQRRNSQLLTAVSINSTDEEWSRDESIYRISWPVCYVEIEAEWELIHPSGGKKLDVRLAAHTTVYYKATNSLIVFGGIMTSVTRFSKLSDRIFAFQLDKLHWTEILYPRTALRDTNIPMTMLTLVGNKLDLLSERAVSREEAYVFATSIGASNFEISAGYLARNQILVHMQLETSPQHHETVKGRNNANLLSIMERTQTKTIAEYERPYPAGVKPNNNKRKRDLHISPKPMTTIFVALPKNIDGRKLFENKE